MDGISILILVALAVALFLLFFVPTIIAFRRHHRERVPILLVNLLLGWSFVGWVVALVWSLTSHVERQVLEGRGDEREGPHRVLSG